MPDLADGERVTVQGSSANSYVLARDRQVYSCTCPAWRNMRLPILQRRCKHLVAYLNDTTLASVSTATRVSNAVVLPVTPPRPAPRTTPEPTSTTYDEPPELRQQRDAALGEAIDLHLVLFDKMEETYGLRLPKEIAYAAGFYLALREDEKAELAKISTRGLAGVGLWFAPGGLDYQGQGDPRLRDRLPDDPPEVVNVMYGAIDKPDARYGLVYDEPSELPVGVVHREPGITTVRKTTLLETIRDDLHRDAPHPDEKTNLRRSNIAAWLNEVIRRARPEIEESALSFQSIGWTRGSFPVPYVPGWSVTEDLVGVREHGDRQRAYASSSPIVMEWIDRAHKDLADGSPGRALFLGRELHMSASASAFRAQATELLIRAYGMLGRGPLLEIIRAHHLDLHPDVELYEPPPPHAIVIATDPEDVARAWDLQPPTESEIEEAFKRAASVEVFDAIFDRVDEDTRDRVTRTALGRRLSQMLRLPPQSPERGRLADLVGRFIDRTSIDARAFERIVQARCDDLAQRAVATVDLASNSQGATPLHIAARFARPGLVKTLLDRGADPRAKNAKGRWPFDDAAAASFHSERDAHEVMLLLEAAGGGVGKVPSLVFSDAPPSWKVGDKVHHSKFGDGVVMVVGGVGDDAKLQVRFGKTKKDIKTLLGKFVERRSP